MPTIKIFKATICEVNIAGAKLSPLNNRITLGLVNINPTVIGAVVNVVLNVLLIPVYGHNGTAVAYMLAEVAVTVSMFIVGRRYIPIQFFKKEHLHYVLGSVVMGGCLCLISLLHLNSIATLLLMIIVGVFVYAIILLCLRNFIGMTLCGLIKRN